MSRAHGEREREVDPYGSVMTMLTGGGLSQEALVSLLGDVLMTYEMGHKEMFGLAMAIAGGTKDGAGGSLAFTWPATQSGRMRVNYQTGSIRVVRMDGEG